MRKYTGKMGEKIMERASSISTMISYNSVADGNTGKGRRGPKSGCNNYVSVGESNMCTELLWV